MVAGRGLTSLSALLENDEYAQKLVNWLYDIECKGHLNILYSRIGSGVMPKEFLQEKLKNLFNNSEDESE